PSGCRLRTLATYPGLCLPTLPRRGSVSARDRVELLEVRGAQLEARAGDVLAQVRAGGGAGNQKNVGRAPREPGQGHRHRRRLEPLGYRRQLLGLQRREAAEREV